MLAFAKVKNPQKLSERVRLQLEKVILDGKLKANEQLPTEADLGQSFGVSRTVIREALQRLEAQGLVQSRIGSGSYVAPYHMDHVKTAMTRFAALNPQRDMFLHLLDLRLVIETEATERLTRRRDSAAIGQLGQVLQRMTECQEDLVAFARADMDFHLRIAEASGNPFFSTILEPLKRIGHEFGLATYENASVVAHTIHDHQLILESITAGDVMVARQRIRDHIDYSRKHYLELLARTPRS
jgi:GntR family transcriptional regulator, transcriptional repressor for pyruvate dehydrogenase complex